MAEKAKIDSSTVNLDFEAKPWLATDKLRNNMDATKYTHVVLGLIFIKYISDFIEEHRAKPLTSENKYGGWQFQRSGQIQSRACPLDARRCPIVLPTDQRQADRRREDHRRCHGRYRARLKVIYAELTPGQHGRNRKSRHKHHLRRNQKKELPPSVMLSPKGLMSTFSAKDSPIYAQINDNLHQPSTLATLRGILLPKLLRGELSSINLRNEY